MINNDDDHDDEDDDHHHHHANDDDHDEVVEHCMCGRKYDICSPQCRYVTRVTGFVLIKCIGMTDIFHIYDLRINVVK